MKTARELYPDCELKYQDSDEMMFLPASNYNPMLAQFGSIIIQLDDHDYQGDVRLLYRRPNYDAIGHEEFGILIFGYGSCSGCDALQACESYEEVDALMLNLESKIKWGDAEQTILYVRTHDWEGEWYSNDYRTRQFFNAVTAILTPIPEED